ERPEGRLLPTRYAEGARTVERSVLAVAAVESPPVPVPDAFEPLLTVVTRVTTTVDEEEAQREAAEVLHLLGTSDALQRLGTRPRHAFARALLRDTRWDSARAGSVPILGAPAPIATATALVALRLRRAARIAATRWAAASVG